MTSELSTIRDMCVDFEVTPRTLRFYEAKELIAPQRDGQKRLYGKRERARLTLILRGRRFGFSLETIRQLLDLYDADARHETQLRKSCEFGRARLAEMQRQRADLDQAIADLERDLARGEARLEGLTQTNTRQQAAG